MDKIGDYIFLAVLLFFIIVMLRGTFRRFRKNAEKNRQYEKALQTAKETERTQQMHMVLPKSKVVTPKTRIPTVDPLGTPFTGSVHGIAAKWEAEIHQLGRQIIGQIDSKMSALQAITMDANRTANRLEILVEHLEQIAREQIEWQQSQIAQNAEDESANVNPVTNVIHAAESVLQAAPLTDVLKELTEDLESIHKTIKKSTTFGEHVKPAVVLRLTELQTDSPETDLPSNLRGEVEMLSNYGVAPEAIARRLNISLGEVDLILQARQNRTP